MMETLATAREDLSSKCTGGSGGFGPASLYGSTLAIDGADLRERPLLDRKGQLAELVRGIPHIHYVEHLEAHGGALFAKVCELDFEGIVAKQADSNIAPAGGRNGSRSGIQATRGKRR